MPRPYSNDLRARVIEEIEAGASRREGQKRRKSRCLLHVGLAPLATMKTRLREGRRVRLVTRAVTIATVFDAKGWLKMRVGPAPSYKGYATMLTHNFAFGRALPRYCERFGANNRVKDQIARGVPLKSSARSTLMSTPKPFFSGSFFFSGSMSRFQISS
jgi:hypothetical protein